MLLLMRQKQQCRESVSIVSSMAAPEDEQPLIVDATTSGSSPLRSRSAPAQQANVRNLLESLSESKSNRRGHYYSPWAFALVLLVVTGGGASIAHKRRRGGGMRGQVMKSNSPSLPPIHFAAKCEHLDDLVPPKNEVSDKTNKENECISVKAQRAADLWRAQSILLDKGVVCVVNEKGGQIITGRVSTNIEQTECSVSIKIADEQRLITSPDWVHHRDSSFGLWIYPRLKLVLFACPKCGNSEVRILLDKVSDFVESGEAEDGMKKNVQSMRGKWKVEGKHSFQAVALNAKESIEALDYVDDLMVNGEWTSLMIVRHPYKRLVSGFVELEFRWGTEFNDIVRDKNGGYREQSMAELEEGSFWHLPLESSERALAFYAEFILSRFAFEATDADGGCAKPIAEAYHIHPMHSFFLRDANQCDESSAYFNAEHTFDADALHMEWPAFIKRWEQHWNSTVAEKFSHMAAEHKNTKALNPNAKAMKDLLGNNQAFKESVDTLFSSDFEMYGFQTDLAILDNYK